MRVEDLDLPEQARAMLRSKGYEELYPPQQAAVELGLLSGQSVLVSAPTASGKTLVALMAAAAHLARRGGRAVYLSPLRALAAEKHEDLSALESIELGGRRPRVALSTGGGDAQRRDPARSDVVVATNERMDYALRRGSAWASSVGLVVADEVHLVGDDRGPALEMALTRLMRARRPPQVVALSATASNAEEIAAWLGAATVESGWRPVGLSEGVCDGESVGMDDGSLRGLDASRLGAAADLGIECVREGGQSLVFAATRPSAVSLATRAAGPVSEGLGAEDRAALAAAARRMLASGERTPMVRSLAGLVRKGAAFHHAGLGQECRRIVEDAFRGRSLKLLASTPTLAAGVNLPARRVVIASLSRYDAAAGGSRPIRVTDYKQMSGRAGRPQYDERGEAIAVTGGGLREAFERYVEGVPEPVESSILRDGPLRGHALGLVAGRPGMPRAAVEEFFSSTLGGAQAPEGGVALAVDTACSFLVRRKMLSEGRGGLRATAFGRLVSGLYLDPAVAHELREGVEAEPRAGWPDIRLLHVVASCSGFAGLSTRRKDAPAAEGLLARAGGDLEGVWPEEVGRGLLVLDMWVREEADARIAGELDAEPGDVHRMSRDAARLARCAADIAGHLGRAGAEGRLRRLEARVQHGVRPELVPLVGLRGLGRVRARALYRAGIRGPAGLAAAPEARVAAVRGIGARLAHSIKAQARGAAR